MKHYYCTPSKKFDTFLCTLGWFAIQMALITAVSEMVGKVAGFLIDANAEKLSDGTNEDEVCTSCADRFKEVASS